MAKIILMGYLFIGSVAAGQSQFGFFAGPQAGTARYTIHGEKQEVEWKYGFHAGAGWKIPFDKNLYFVPSFNYSLTGFSVTLNKPAFPPDVLAKNNDVTLHFADINFALQYNIGNNPSHLFFRAGASFNTIIRGTEKYELTDGKKISRNMKFNFRNYGRWLASWIVQLGYETKSDFFIAARYVRMPNMDNADEGPAIRPRTVMLTFGKFLKPRKKK
ncbi:MAG: hypothetical protein C4308_04545 [Chitinophagaceae bacterium]